MQIRKVQIKIYFMNHKMNCLAVSDSEFTEQLKLLNRQQLEDLGSVFQRRYEILRNEYQNKLRNPPTVPASVNPVMVVSVPQTQMQNQSQIQVVENGSDQIIIPQSPGRSRRSPRRRRQISFETT